MAAEVELFRRGFSHHSSHGRTVEARVDASEEQSGRQSEIGVIDRPDTSGQSESLANPTDLDFR